MDPAAGAAVDIASDDKKIHHDVKPSGDAHGRTSNLTFEDYRGFEKGLDGAIVQQQFLAFINGEKPSSYNGGGDGVGNGNGDGGVDDDDDDDCVILEGDPDKTVVVAVEKKLEEDGSEAELQITAEKGEVACRDFPHPRHLCALLPFGASPPANHCTMCHCYVCDSRAPCAHWGNGTSYSYSDHCHATDKDETWKHLREYKKLGPSQRKRKQNRISAPSSSQVNQPSSLGRVHAPSNGDLNLLTYSSFRAQEKMGRGASLPKLPVRRAAITRESFKRSAPPSPTVYTSPFYYNLHRSLYNGDSVHPESSLRLLQARQVAQGKNTATVSSQAHHSHQRAVDQSPLLRAIQVPPAASRLQLTPSRAAAAAAGVGGGGGSSSAAIHGAQFSHDKPINRFWKSWKDVVSSQSLHETQFSPQVKASQGSSDNSSQGSSDSSNVPAVAPRLLTNDEIMKMLKSEEKACERRKKKSQKWGY